jgi:S-adenosylmethionine decarboxylase
MSGLEWIVEAHGCDPAALADAGRWRNCFRADRALDLHPLGKTSWHQFPNTGGITGVSLLTESHLACHTFPEYGSLCLNVFCCRPRPPPILRRC